MRITEAAKRAALETLAQQVFDAAGQPAAVIDWNDLKATADVALAVKAIDTRFEITDMDMIFDLNELLAGTPHEPVTYRLTV